MMSNNNQLPASFVYTRRAALPVAGVSIALCALGWWMAPARFFEAYLFAFFFVSSMSLGCAGVLMIYHLVGGRWGFVARRVLEAGAWGLLFMPLAALPLAFGVETLYVWAQPEVVAHDPLLKEKAAYLNEPFFLARSAGYLALWALLAGLLIGLSPPQNAGVESVARRAQRLSRISAVGLVLYGLSVTFAAVDWMMSLEPHWFSAIYGVIAMAGQGVVGFALPIAVLAWLQDDPQVRRLYDSGRSRDLGTLLFAAVAFWMYVTFSQFLIIWSGNLPEEITWYLARSTLGWKIFAALLIVLHFVVPFALLLSPRVKQSRRWLGGVAWLLLAMRAAELFWQIMPPLRDTLWPHRLDAVCLLTLVALWWRLVTWRLQRVGVVPVFAEEFHEPQPGKLAHAKPAP